MIKFNRSETTIESFGDKRYLVYLQCSEQDNVDEQLINLLSRHFGVPTGRVVIRSSNRENRLIDIG